MGASSEIVANIKAGALIEPDPIVSTMPVSERLADVPSDQLVRTFDGGLVYSPSPAAKPEAANQVAAFNPGGGVWSPHEIPTTDANVKEYSLALPQGTPTIPNERKRNPATGAVIIGLGIAAFYLWKTKGKK